jgi:hypothetical protein
MIHTISERVFKNGGITRKDINNIIDKTLRNLDSYRGFQKVRDLVVDFGKATRKRDRGEIIVALGAIGWNGIFNAEDIAKVLLDYKNRDMGVSIALDKLARWEDSYKANMNDIKVLRLGAKQVLLKKWEATFAVTARQIELQVDDGVKTHFPVSVEGTGNIYAFLKMLLLVRPMLMPRGIKFTFDTLDAIKGVWSMGESKIAYGERGWNGKEMLKSDKKHHNYFGNYALPDEVKEVILDCLQDAIAEVEYDTGHDYEGNSYNSLKYKPIPEKGLWLGARKKVA